MDARFESPMEQPAAEFAEHATTPQKAECADAADDEIGFGADAQYQDGFARIVSFDRHGRRL